MEQVRQEGIVGRKTGACAHGGQKEPKGTMNQEVVKSRDAQPTGVALMRNTLSSDSLYRSLSAAERGLGPETNMVKYTMRWSARQGPNDLRS
jgi:hypothetical protein